MRKYRTAIIVVFILLVIVAAIVFIPRHSKPAGSLKVSYWYWHTPFKLSKNEVKSLNDLGVTELYVHDGTITPLAGQLRALYLQDWTTKPQQKVCLVFDFAPSFTRQFEKEPVNTNADMIQSVIQAETQRIRLLKIGISGVQLDFDCPTRLLPRYSELLRHLGKFAHNQKLSLSITALPTWYTSRNVNPVLDVVDYSVPQFYEGQLPKSIDKFSTVSSINAFKRQFNSVTRSGYPFYAGLPAYSHPLVYSNGKLEGQQHEVSVEDALRDQRFKWIQSFGTGQSSRSILNGDGVNPSSYTGEDICVLNASDNILNHRTEVQSSDSELLPMNSISLVYDIPTPVMVKQHLDYLRQHRDGNCLGVIFYRMPKGATSEALPINCYKDIFENKPLAPHLKLTAKIERQPWEAIETSRNESRMPMRVNLYVTNDGNTGTFPAPNSIQIELQLNKPGMSDMVNGALDCEVGISDGNTWQQSSLLRANAVKIIGGYLQSGETAPACIIDIPSDGATSMDVSWKIRNPGGFSATEGKISNISLKP